MLVYANTLHFKADADLEMALLVLEQTLAQLSGEEVSLGGKLPFNPYKRQFDDGSRYVFGKYERDGEAQYSIKYSRKDAELTTRLWHTTISFRRIPASDENTEITTDCKVTVETEDFKPTETPAVVYVPPIVGKFMKHLPLSILTPQPNVVSLTNGDSVYELNSDIEFNDRRYAIVIVCPDDNDEMPIKSARLAYLAAGLAQVYEIDVKADWDGLVDILGYKFVPKSGEVKFIYPVNQNGGFMIPQFDYRPFKINGLKADNIDVEQEMFSQIAQRLARTHAYRQTTPENVAKLIKYQNFQDIKRHAQQTAEETLSKEISEIFSDTDRELDNLRTETKDLKTENRRLKYELQTLQEVFQPTSNVPVAAFDYVELKKILDIACERYFVEDSLTILQATFPERIVVLNSGFTSANESRTFREKKRAFHLLWKLATDYYQSLCEGKPDAQARQIFGDDFSAKESETVEKNAVARQLRIFTYKGNDYEMMAHLRIGTKDSVADTLRVHFRWFADEQKIVIGHCGKHLNFG
jgi:hypothetical protein